MAYFSVQKVLDRDVLTPLLALFRDHKIGCGEPTTENFRKYVSASYDLPLFKKKLSEMRGLKPVLRNRAILPRFRFRFRVPKFLSTVPVPAPVPVPTLKNFKLFFSVKSPADYFDFGFFSRQLHACVGQCPVREYLVRYFFATGTGAGT